MARFDYDRAASVLVEAAYFGDKKAAENWDLSERTVQRYRKRLDEDDELAAFVARKKREFESQWTDEISVTLRSALRFIRRAANEADPTDPDVIHAVAGAFKIIAEVGITKDVLDARLAEFNRAERAADGEVVTVEPHRLPD